jgi:hypothetical protein
VSDESNGEGIQIAFNASFYKLTTLTDGGIRISFDVSLSELQSVIQLPALEGRLLQVGVVPIPRRRRNQDES